MSSDAWGEHTEIILEAQAPALFVTLETGSPAWFSDNVLTLLPSDPVTVRISSLPGQNSPDAELMPDVRDLYSATTQ